MTPEESARLGGLLLGQRLIALGVVVDGEPIVGLARHSGGLVAGAPWSGMIHEPDSAGTDPLQVPRLQLEGVVDPLIGDRAEFHGSSAAARKAGRLSV